MTRIAGLMHWGKVQSVEAEIIVAATMKYMIRSDDFVTSSNSWGTFCFEIGSTSIATYKGNSLILDGMLLENATSST